MTKDLRFFLELMTKPQLWDLILLMPWPRNIMLLDAVLPNGEQYLKSLLTDALLTKLSKKMLGVLLVTELSVKLMASFLLLNLKFLLMENTQLKLVKK